MKRSPMGSHVSRTLSACLRVVLSSSMVPLISSSCSRVRSIWRCWSTQRAVSFSHSSLATVACFQTNRLMFWIRCLGETSGNGDGMRVRAAGQRPEGSSPQEKEHHQKARLTVLHVLLREIPLSESFHCTCVSQSLTLTHNPDGSSYACSESSLKRKHCLKYLTI